jgi:hypothetical protein
MGYIARAGCRIGQKRGGFSSRLFGHAFLPRAIFCGRMVSRATHNRAEPIEREAAGYWAFAAWTHKARIPREGLQSRSVKSFVALLSSQNKHLQDAASRFLRVRMRRRFGGCSQNCESFIGTRRVSSGSVALRSRKYRSG